MIRRPPRSTLFPTRRSSDLLFERTRVDPDPHGNLLFLGDVHDLLHEGLAADVSGVEAQRSEEHTSELQSQSNIVCRLLLEKKKTMYESRPAFAWSLDGSVTV